MSGRVAIEDIEEKGDQEFLEFVQEQIARMQKYSKLGNEGNITFLDLNKALTSFEQVYLTLIGLYNITNIEFQREQERYDDWYAERFLNIRARENPKDMSAQKWSSTKEIEMMVRREYNFEFKGRKESLLILERKVAFLRRLLEAWQAQQYILSTLSKNVQAEVGASLMSEK